MEASVAKYNKFGAVFLRGVRRKILSYAACAWGARGRRGAGRRIGARTTSLSVPQWAQRKDPCRTYVDSAVEAVDVISVVKDSVDDVSLSVD